MFKISTTLIVLALVFAGCGNNKAQEVKDEPKIDTKVVSNIAPKKEVSARIIGV